MPKIETKHVTVNLNTEAIVPAIMRAVEQGLIDTADEVVQTAKSLAPVDTGTLKNSIRREDEVEFEDKKMSIQVIADPSQQGSEDGYARYVEEGTSRQAPQPFLRPAGELMTKNLAPNIAKHFKGIT